MSRYGLAFALTIGALTFLSSPHQTQAAAASHVLGRDVADNVLDQNIVDPVHYSRRYGWHCGMWERYGHGHREICWRMRHGGYWGGGGGSRRHHWDDNDGKRDHDGGDRDRDGGKGDRNGGDGNGGDRDGGDRDGGDKY